MRGPGRPTEPVRASGLVGLIHRRPGDVTLENRPGECRRSETAWPPGYGTLMSQQRGPAIFVKAREACARPMGPEAVRGRAGGAGEPFRPDMHPRRGRVDDAGTVRTKDRVFEFPVREDNGPMPASARWLDRGGVELGTVPSPPLRRRRPKPQERQRLWRRGPEEGRVGASARRSTRPERFKPAGIFKDFPRKDWPAGQPVCDGPRRRRSTLGRGRS